MPVSRVRVHLAPARAARSATPLGISGALCSAAAAHTVLGFGTRRAPLPMARDAPQYALTQEAVDAALEHSKLVVVVVIVVVVIVVVATVAKRKRVAAAAEEAGEQPRTRAAAEQASHPAHPASAEARGQGSVHSGGDSGVVLPSGSVGGGVGHLIRAVVVGRAVVRRQLGLALTAASALRQASVRLGRGLEDAAAPEAEDQVAPAMHGIAARRLLDLHRLQRARGRR
jgi:hypothetical protein